MHHRVRNIGARLMVGLQLHVEVKYPPPHNFDSYEKRLSRTVHVAAWMSRLRGRLCNDRLRMSPRPGGGRQEMHKALPVA